MKTYNNDEIHHKHRQYLQPVQQSVHTEGREEKQSDTSTFNYLSFLINNDLTRLGGTQNLHLVNHVMESGAGVEILTSKNH